MSTSWDLMRQQIKVPAKLSPFSNGWLQPNTGYIQNHNGGSFSDVIKRMSHSKYLPPGLRGSGRRKRGGCAIGDCSRYNPRIPTLSPAQIEAFRKRFEKKKGNGIGKKVAAGVGLGTLLGIANLAHTAYRIHKAVKGGKKRKVGRGPRLRKAGKVLAGVALAGASIPAALGFAKGLKEGYDELYGGRKRKYHRKL